MEVEFELRQSQYRNSACSLHFSADQALWLDVNRIEIPARTGDEPRTLVIGRIQDRHWSAVVTYREAQIRIISVRRSRKEEVEIYEGKGI